MDRRFSSFVLASTAFFLVYMSLRVMFVPPPVPPKPVKPVDQVVPSDAAGPGGSSIADLDENGDAVEGDPSEAEKIDRPDQPEWRTLGSMDPATGHFMLVTLNSRGAGIERLELTERKSNGRLKYRRVDVRSGYLGYFAADPTSTINGVKLNIVGPGTPADLAVCDDKSVAGGLKQSDVIVSINGNPINNSVMMDEWLLGTEPGDELQIEVLRGGDDGATAQPLNFKVKLSEHPLDLLRLANTAGEDQVPGNLSRLSALMTVGKVGRREIAPGEKALATMDDPGDLIWSVAEEKAGSDSSEQSESSEQPGASQQSESIAFEVRLSDSEMKAAGGRAIGMRRSYSLQPGSYVLDMGVQIDNRSDEPQELAYRLEGVNGVTLEGWWYSNKISPNWSGSAARDVVYRTTTEGHELVSGYGLLKRARAAATPDDQNLFAPDSPTPDRELKYIGIDAQYFTVAYLPEEGQASFNSYRRAIASLAVNPSAIPESQERAVNATFYLDSAAATVPPGSSLKQNLRLFAGPKQPDLFAQYGLEDCIYYGWFSWPAKLLGQLLHLLSGVGNYALAIVLLTVCVRAAMFPLSRKAAVNAQRMQELAPELKKITEKHKDDMEARVRAQRELQQRVGFNPLSGCLPMLVQLPIFIGLYRTLSVDIELRQAAFASWTTWSSNLAAPDMLTFWGDWLWGYLSGRGTGWLGPYFNILPVLVMLLFLAQQKMFMPPATDEQTALTQKMMSWMTLIMGLFFFRVPAGLCIYFITSSLWGIGERIFVKRTLPKSPHFDKAILEGTVNHRGGDSGGDAAAIVAGKSPTPASPKPGSEGNSWADKLRQKLNPEEPVAPLPRDRKRPAAGNKKKKR